MNTSIYNTRHRNRTRSRQQRRGLRILLAMILLMCLLSACVVPVAAQTLGADTPPEMTESADVVMELSDSDDSIADIITQEGVDSPAPVASGDTTWQEDYKYYTHNRDMILQEYKRDQDPDGNQDLVVYATATVKGVTYNVQIKDNLYADARYIRSVRFEDGVVLNTEASIQSMFRECFSLESVDFGTLSTPDLQILSYMFYNCVNLRSVDMSMFDTSKVQHTEEMFKNCYRLESVKLSNWDTTQCFNMWYMFADCMNLKSLDISGWNTKKAKGTGYTMDGMFSVGLEELTVGPEFCLGSKASGLIGVWTDGTNTWTASELQQYLYSGNHAGTYRRVAMGGDRNIEVSREQETLALPEGYRATDELGSDDKKDMIQRNGQISDSNKNADGQLVKTAEWTNQDAGTAAIDLTYAVPSQGGARAVYACGTCNVHGFGADVMIIQLLELLDQYDYVDVLTTSSQYWKYQKSDFLETAREAAFTLSAADGRDANYNKLRTMLIPDYSDVDNYNIIVWNSHASGAAILSYLGDYLKDNKPAAIYVSFDGSRAFAEDESDGHRATLMPLLYGVQPGEGSLSVTYDDLRVDEAAMQTLADYQRDGRYYVCICDSNKFKLNVYNYCRAYYDYREDSSSAKGHESRLLCYASVALASPYYYVYNHEDLLAYLEDENAEYQDIKPYSSLITVGQPLINYGASFTSQGVQYVSAPLTITDTVEDGLEIDKDNISVQVTQQGVPVTNRPDIQVTVTGQDIRIYLSEVSIGEVVSIHIPVALAAGTERFCTDNADFRDTNHGAAKVVTAAGKTVETDAPRLFKGTFKIMTEVVHGTITDPITGIPIGEDREVIYAPCEGYHLESITVDGADADIEEFADGYSFLDITEDHVIKVVYVADEVPEEPEEPAAPEEPDDPAGPEEPDVPAEPEEPAEPEQPEEPEEPAEPEQPTEPENPVVPGDTEESTNADEPQETTHRTEHHKTVNYTTENYKTVNKVVANETATNTVEAPETEILEAGNVVVETAVADPGPATGDDTRMMLYLSLAIVATLALLGWIAMEVRRLDRE